MQCDVAHDAVSFDSIMLSGRLSYALGFDSQMFLDDLAMDSL